MSLTVTRHPDGKSWGCGNGKIVERRGNDFLIDDGRGNQFVLNQGEYTIEEY